MRTPPVDQIGSLGDRGSDISEIIFGRKLMGGRNSQSHGRISRSAGALITQRRLGATIATNIQELPPNTMAYDESDTNADTCYLGINFCILSYNTCTADVFTYDKYVKLVENIHTVTGATAHDGPLTGFIVILISPTSLYIMARSSIIVLYIPTKCAIMARTIGTLHMIGTQA